MIPHQRQSEPDWRPDEARGRDRVTSSDEDGELARLARALGHPARVHILKVLLAKDTCIAGELSDELPLAASTVSQHLKVLKKAGLVKGEVDGPRRCYCVDRAAFQRLKTLVREL
jgi:ArsR family transcriptional regulator